MRSKVRLPAAPAEITRPVRGRDEYMPGRFRIREEDLEKFGCTVGGLVTRWVVCGAEWRRKYYSGGPYGGLEEEGEV